MEALKKGSHAPRVAATCERCGVTFERSAVHPYIVTCPACRGKERAGTEAERTLRKKVRCPACRDMIAKDGGLGMHRCSRCKEQWWSMPGALWREWVSDETFQAGRYVGNVRDEGFKAVYDRATQGT